MELPVEILYGIYLGLLTGIIPAIVSGVLGFLFKYFTGVTIPGFGVVVLALAIAGVNGGLLALNDPSVRASERAPAILTAIIVVLMLALYAHAQGDKLGSTAPKRLSLRSLRNRTLSADVVELVGGRGRARVEIVGEVGDMEGYPPLSAETRAAIADGEWTFPADVPIAELETRLADRLRTEFELADVSVSMDEHARAIVQAAPPTGGLSRRVPDGRRAVSIAALMPTGVTRGDEVTVFTPGGAVDGTVVSARSSPDADRVGGASAAPASAGDDLATDGGSGDAAGTDADVPSPSVPVTTGGEGRITVAVARSDARPLLEADRGRVLVRSRGTRREFELTALIRRAGKRFRRVSVVAGGPLDGATIGDVDVRDRYDVAIVAAKHGSWVIAPRGDQHLSAGDELFVVGTRDALDGFAEVAA
ncbi:potassium channel family protein [Halopenitus persicus]|uniref:TrkA-C domain-containing protein n=1 Tax=Halopenitus persicus TaxID=1048396 RepID=A0A1H3EHS0_9EURY|nr:TrkA C-terminal domain-containing protein [Halopenitus persicus]QHS17566.1 potassium transporter TrkA [haloarchaeon 3A1-DGR]SDX78137.1 TrkA-C domain-containing protein [Halopenitus persicus]